MLNAGDAKPPLLCVCPECGTAVTGNEINCLHCAKSLVPTDVEIPVPKTRVALTTREIVFWIAIVVAVIIVVTMLMEDMVFGIFRR